MINTSKRDVRFEHVTTTRFRPIAVRTVRTRTKTVKRPLSTWLCVNGRAHVTSQPVSTRVLSVVRGRKWRTLLWMRPILVAHSMMRRVILASVTLLLHALLVRVHQLILILVVRYRVKLPTFVQGNILSIFHAVVGT